MKSDQDTLAFQQCSICCEKSKTHKAAVYEIRSRRMTFSDNDIILKYMEKGYRNFHIGVIRVIASVSAL